MDENQIKLFGSKHTDEWETPQDIFNMLNSEFHFDLDVAAAKNNTKCARYFTQEDDALKQDWVGNVWCNPPYSKVRKFFKKLHEELNNGNCKVAVFLVFSNTDTKWFHDYVLGKSELRFVKGRLKFKGMNKKGEWVNNSAMRPSMICVFKP